MASKPDGQMEEWCAQVVNVFAAVFGVPAIEFKVVDSEEFR